MPGKRPIDFVITGFPRSGTNYTANLLTKIGGTAGHELSFSHNRHIDHRDVEEDRIWGDVSWLAAPYVSRLPESTSVLWQVRDTVKVLDSCLPGKGSLVGGARASGPYARFVARHLPDLEGEDEQERILWWYIHWHDMLARQASESLEVPGRIDYLYRLEDLANLDTGVLINICFLTGISSKFTKNDELEDKLQYAVDHVSPLTNHRGKPTPWAEEYLKTHDTEATRMVIDIIDMQGYSKDRSYETPQQTASEEAT